MNGDDQARLLTEIRDLLAAANEHAEATKHEYLSEYRQMNARDEAYSQSLEAYSQSLSDVQKQVYEYGYKLGAMKIAMWLVGAIEVAIAVWIMSHS